MLRVLGNTKKRERMSFSGIPYVTAGVKVDVNTPIASQASTTDDYAPSAQTLAYRAEMEKLYGKGNILLDTMPKTNVDVANDIAAQKAQEIVGADLSTPMYNLITSSMTDMPELSSDAYQPGPNITTWNPEFEAIMKPVTKKWWEESWFTYGMFGFSILSGVILYMKNRKEPNYKADYRPYNSDAQPEYQPYTKGGQHAKI